MRNCWLLLLFKKKPIHSSREGKSNRDQTDCCLDGLINLSERTGGTRKGQQRDKDNPPRHSQNGRIHGLYQDLKVSRNLVQPAHTSATTARTEQCSQL